MMAPRKRSQRRKSITRLSPEQRKQIIDLSKDGYSLRAISAEVGISKSTLHEWICGPLTDELEKVLRDRKREPRHAAPPAVVGEDVYGLLHAHRADQEVIEELPPKRAVESSTIFDPFPQFPFGGVLESRGKPDSPEVPNTEIQFSVSGEPICSRCGQPVGGDPHELLFDTDAAGIHRPVCKDCWRDGEALHGWPGPRGGEMKAAPGLGDKPNPVVKPFPDIVMIPNTKSVWSK
jgi:hypothetical protein